MPVLHKYKDKDFYYALTSIGGNIVTFQLTDTGQYKLLAAGLQSGQQFGRALLLDLYRSGDAYTHGSGPGEVEAIYDERQMEFDFKNDPEPETLFPSCSKCSSINDLHLVEMKSEHRVSMFCLGCRDRMPREFDAAIPLSLVSREILTKLLLVRKIEKIDAAVLSYQALLNAEFEKRWEELARRLHSKNRQNKLFSDDGGKQGSLI